MKRRAFIGMATALAMGLGWRAKSIQAAMDGLDVGAADEASALVDHLLRAFPQRESLQVIGGVYRRKQVESTTASGVCMSDVFQGFLRHLDLSNAEFQRMTPAAMRRCIDAETTRDFSEGRIISVDGWLLGETEARLCEVAALRMV
ncbi:MAG: hypothetical protein ACR2RF_05305 [Geminicoccaceae bacterium]